MLTLLSRLLRQTVLQSGQTASPRTSNTIVLWVH
jgi:hypothetical protein